MKILKILAQKVTPKNHELSAEDTNYYGKITIALAETIRTMAEIDDTSEEHGFSLVGSQTV